MAGVGTRDEAGPLTARPAARRNVALDALRGVAVLGIFMMNIQAFAMVQDAYSDPLAQMDFGGANRWVWIVSHVGFELKFITIFSVLFGAGVAMTAGSGKDGALERHSRRMGWLLAMGAIHAWLLWYGDILVAYAVWGLVAALFLERRTPWLIVTGILLVGVTALGFWSQYAGWDASAGAFPPSTWRPSDSDIRDAAEIARAVWPVRVIRSAGNTANVELSGLIYYGPRVLGCMMIGMALHRSGFFTAGWRASRYAIGAAIGLALGLGAGAVTARADIAAGFTPHVMQWTTPLDHMASLAAAFGYACVVMLAAKPAALAPLLRPFAAVGRMALTNYIAQTVIACLIVYGPPGLGLFGRLERVQQFEIVLAVWAAQMVWSPLWLRHFRFGPLEWAWRSLNYRQAQPFRKRGAG